MSDEIKEQGLALFRQGARVEALARFEEAAASYAAAGDALGQGEVLNNIGVIRRMERQWEEAAAAFDEAEARFVAAGDRVRQAQVIGNRADLYAYHGKTEEAARAYSDAAALMAAAGDGDKQGQLLRALSLLRLRQRRIMEAIQLLELSLQARAQLNPLQRLFLPLLGLLGRLTGRA